MKKTTIIVMTMMFALFAIQFTTAEPVNPQDLDVGPSETRDLSGLPTQSADAQGGNVTQLNIHTIAVTRSWQGYYGNITGDIVLDDASGNTFYNWTLTTPSGEVYASRTSTVDFSTIACASSAQRGDEETYLDQTPADGDSVTNTYNFTAHPEINIGAVTLTQDTCFSTNAFSDGTQDASRFYQLLLADGTSNIVYTTIIDPDQIGFDGSSYDFQLLVGENEKPGNEGPTEYFFFVQIV